ncbi:MAG: glycosyltransferase family 2 protein, partial [Alphaproteobacteria bacterium]|nr:glycosyltransferase family 2 protein [Alphaproteobacteria bacterium]
MTVQSPHLVSIVVPCFNEARSLGELVERAGRAVSASSLRCEFVLVDDGSHDDTWSAICGLGERDSSIRGIRLSRNFGKETALLAGLDAARGDAVVLIDADLQHPPELIATFIEKWQAGHNVVYAARRDRSDEEKFRAPLTRTFYRLFNALSDVRIREDAGDFRLISRRVVDVILRLRERTRFTKGIFAWVGFDALAVPFDVAPRQHGKTSFTPLGLIRFAFHGLVSFTTAPLKLGIVIGAVSAIAALALGAFYLIRTILIGVDVPGYASIIVSVLALGSLTLLQLGLIGLYVGRIYDEVKGRPSYVVRDEIGATPGQPPP